MAGQRKGGDLETKLNELYTLSLGYQAKANDAQSLYDLLNILLHEHGFDSKMFDESVKAEQGVIYVLQEHLENCFGENGKQIAPVSMLIEHESVSSFVEIINSTKLFFATLKECNENTKQAHIELHPIYSQK
ncbi:DUF2913 family protein [Photobacterium frigidiphilum]|uniref:DUF2913 family protein n=1 Tax=Photobacterium frigidiphilum TaxID=264736 RepID=UPI003D10E376